ncbi:zinc metalloproteinase nas-4-like protein [Dinothrombium tinctorium]|uniref:Zinc metalloproteinase nas-4-like protein n=1 Tax=Dinothrombium tinctorium TaxID=1965070 RepID=A0A443R1N2_9ACAR|nr:zinc metalloproteinase nas-4-like protein [Dinothrombium tinctorium]
MHAIGFMHEMSRPDAHKYITVHWDNINEDNKGNFWQMRDDWLEQAGFNYSAMFPYDKYSVLHYTTYQQAKDNSRPTITLKSGGTITKATSLSEIDIKELRYFYNCTAIDKSFEKQRKRKPINPPPHYCYNTSESSNTFCILDSEALFAQSFSEQNATKLTTQAFTSDLWHLNYGRTPSTYNENDSYTNFYLHLGESYYSYRRLPPKYVLVPILLSIPVDYDRRMATYKRRYKLPSTIQFNNNDKYFCIAFRYKLWGDDFAMLEVGLVNKDRKWLQFFTAKNNVTSENNIYREDKKWIDVNLNCSLKDIPKNVSIAFAGWIVRGGNIGVDDIVVYRCPPPAALIEITIAEYRDAYLLNLNETKSSNARFQAIEYAKSLSGEKRKLFCEGLQSLGAIENDENSKLNILCRAYLM